MSSEKVTSNGVTDSNGKEDSSDGKAISSQLENVEKKEILDNADGKSLGVSNVGNVLPSFVKLSVSRNVREYNMNHTKRGHCLIFNHSRFDKITNLNERNGTDRDRDNIYKLFKTLGFDVAVYNNLTHAEIKNILDQYAMEMDHSEVDCLAVFFLSHGEDGHLYARNAIFKAEELFAPFTADNCPSLAGKPKMFFIQACRGDGLDSGVMVYENMARDETDFGGVYKIPSHCDFLVCWSTVPGYYSWRNTSNGSWFIQSLCFVFSKYAAEEDVVSMMTEANRHMSLSFESNCPSNSHMHGMKQSAYLTFTLTRKIFLRPKAKKN